MTDDPYPDGPLRRLHEYMTSPTPRPDHDRDLVSPADRQLADALRDAGRSWGEVPEDVAARHLAAITALAAEHAHGAARPRASTWRSRMRRVAGLTIVKVAVGAGVAAATTGGLAAGGNLPDRVQDAVAEGARWVGIELPRPSSTTAPDTPPQAPDPTPQGPDATSEAPVVTPEDRPEQGPTEAPVPATSGSADVGRGEGGPPRGDGADGPDGPPADLPPSANDGAPPGNPGHPPSDSPPTADDDAGPAVGGPAGGETPEADGRDERPTPRPPSDPGGHDTDSAGDRHSARPPGLPPG